MAKKIKKPEITFDGQGFSGRGDHMVAFLELMVVELEKTDREIERKKRGKKGK